MADCWHNGRMATHDFAVMRDMANQQSVFELLDDEGESAGGLSDFTMSLKVRLRCTLCRKLCLQHSTQLCCTLCLQHSVQLHTASYFEQTLNLDDTRPGMYEPWSIDDGMNPKEFADYTGMPKDEFCDAIDELKLLPDWIVTDRRHRVSRHFAVFLLYFRWRSDLSWARMSSILNINRCKLIDIYISTCLLICVSCT